MISQPIARLVTHSLPRPTQLLFGTLLGLMAFGSTAPRASANPLQSLPIVGDLLGVTRQAPPLPSELDFFHDNVQGNNVNLCVLTCNTPQALPPQARPPQARPPVPQGARLPQALPPQARPPQGSRQTNTTRQVARPAARPAARPGSSPNVTVDLSPINIPL